MSVELQILLALLLDAIIGDPRWLPHPVRLIGSLSLYTEQLCRKVIPWEKMAGIYTVIIVLAVTGCSAWVIVQSAKALNPLLGDLVSVLLLYTCFATRDLLGHSKKVADALHREDLVDARTKVGLIVGRDTRELDKAGVVRACVESVAENTVDGVTAPLFWAVAGGPVGSLLYKAVNTMDSIFGYRNDRYEHFGWAPARLDDLVNWIPARITGMILVLSSWLLRLRPAEAWQVFCRDRLKHSSPNSGHAEAAVAGALGIQLGGTSWYSGNPVHKPTIGKNRFSPGEKHIDQTHSLLIVATVLMTLLLLCVRIFCCELLV